METFTALLRQIGQLLDWWVIVAPWEQALRVRGGRRVRCLPPGVHLKIPFVDTVYVQSVRLRIAALSMQTVMTADRLPLTVAGALGYTVVDIEKLYRTLHHAHDTLTTMAMMALAESVAKKRAEDLTPESIAAAATAAIDFAQYGLGDASVRVTDFAITRTFRLISDARWGAYGDSLNVEHKQP